MEARRASASVADLGPASQEGWAPEQQDTRLTRAQSVGSRGQLARRSSSLDAPLLRRQETVTREQRQIDRGAAPAVRLDMDLDVEINLKAKIKGRIELSILSVVRVQPAMLGTYDLTLI
ncbi:7b492809-bcff-4656-8cdd-404fe7fe0d0f [Thermothielavioides terrestris]|nr:7b492809-bcff-4656-8cdd-404fe7fe0d0f [Thermothielavioides terrestris]